MKFEIGEGKHKIFCEIKEIGEDFLLIIYGGEKPHIGSICIAQPRTSLKEKSVISCTSSVFNFLGHKDEPIARMFAEKICKKTERKVIGLAGIHIESATYEEINIILEHSKKLLKKVESLFDESLF